MPKRHSSKYIVIVLLLLILVAVVAFKSGWLRPGGANTAKSLPPGFYSINHFVDGDTIAVNMDGHEESVRFIGVDTPETHKPNTPVQCFGPQAAAFTQKEIGSTGVRLVSDSLSTDRDRYGRLLRYVYLPNGTNLNESLIQNGFGFYYPYFPFSKSVQFSADEQAAIATKKGLWGRCQPTPSDDGGYKMNELAN